MILMLAVGDDSDDNHWKCIMYRVRWFYDRLAGSTYWWWWVYDRDGWFSIPV